MYTLPAQMIKLNRVALADSVILLHMNERLSSIDISHLMADLNSYMLGPRSPSWTATSRFACWRDCRAWRSSSRTCTDFATRIPSHIDFYTTFSHSLSTTKCSVYQTHHLPWSSGHEYVLHLCYSNLANSNRFPVSACHFVTSAGDRGSIPRGYVTLIPHSKE